MAETAKSEDRRRREGFYLKYIQGYGIDVGSGKEGGYVFNPISYDNCFHHDLSDCNAETMEIFEDETFDYTYSSHCLEHLNDYVSAIRNWYRITKTNGFIIIAVPSLYRYEKKLKIPMSNYNGDHKRGYTPASLLREVEEALEPNSYLVEYLKDCADGFDWTLPPDCHSCGEYQIELVIKKIEKPNWRLL